MRISLRAAVLAVVLMAGGCHKRTLVTALPPAPNPPVPAAAAATATNPAPPPPVVAPPAEPVVPPATVAIDEADRAFSAANYARAITRYEDYLRLATNGNQRDKALFQLGIILSLPEYPQHDWERSVSRLKQLVSEYPQSPFKPAAQTILGLRAEITQLGTDKEKQDQRIRQLTSELDRLKRIDAERLRKP